MKALLRWMFLASIPGTLLARSPAPSPAPVEPAVTAAFEAARARLPAEHREALADFTVLRAAKYPIPEDSPLMTQLLGCAVHAWTSTYHKQITVADAAVKGEGWNAPAASRADVRDLLAELADRLAVPVPARPEDAALDAAWKDFVRVMAEVSRVPWPDAGAPGNPAVLDQLVRELVRLSLGGTRPPLEELLVHELGHAVQDSGGTVEDWAALSKWIEAENGTAADGFVGGSWAVEEPIVMLRLLMKGERGPSTVHRPSKDATFVTPYASFDPREDFAESYRMFVTDPARLAKASPEKLLAIAALGWSLRGSAVEPGPVAFEGTAPAWATDLGPGVERLIGRMPPEAPARVGAAILRGTAPLLEKLAIAPTAHAAFVVPPDLPAAFQRRWPDDAGSFTVAGKTVHLDPAKLADELEADVDQYLELEEFQLKLAGPRSDESILGPILDEKDVEDAGIRLAASLDQRPDPATLPTWAAHASLQDKPYLVAILAAEKARLPGASPGEAKALAGLCKDLTPYQVSVVARRLARAGAAPDATRVEAALALLEGRPGTTFVPAARVELLRAKGDPEAARQEAARILVPKMRKQASKDL